MGVAVDAPRFSTHVRIAGLPEVRGITSFHQRGTTHFYTTLDGHVGELQVNSVGRLDGKHLDLKLDLPNAEPQAVRAVFPDWPVNETVVAHAELNGDIPKFRTTGHFVVGPSIVDAAGDMRFGAETSVRLAVTGQHVDLRAVLPDSPPTDIDTQGEVYLRAQPEGVTLDFSGKTEATTIGGFLVPPADFTGRFAKHLLEGRGTLHEPGMPVETSFALETRTGVIDIDARAKRVRLERTPRLHALLPADGTADIHAKGHIEKGRLDARFDADVENFAIGVVSVGRGSVHGRASGPLKQPDALTLEVSGEGRKFRAGEFWFDKVAAKVKGPAGRLDLEASLESTGGPSIALSTKLRAVGGTRLDDVDLAIRRDQVSIQARAASIDIGAGSVEARDVRLEGAGGTLAGHFLYRPNLFELEAHGEGVDLGAVSRVLGVSRGALSGKIDVNAELVAASDVRRGDVRLKVTDGAFGPIGGVSMDARRGVRRGGPAGRSHDAGERLWARARSVGHRDIRRSLRP